MPERVWLVFREPGGLDSVWGTSLDAERYFDSLADEMAERGIDLTIERYEVRRIDGLEGGNE